MKKLSILLATLFLISIVIQPVLAATPGPVCEELSNLTVDFLRETQGGVECYDERYNPILDINKDELISVADVLLLASNVRNWGLEQSEAWCQERLENTTNPCLGPNCQELYDLSVEILKTEGPIECENNNYNFIADINKDAYITVADVLLLASNVRNWGLEQSEAWCQERLENTTNPCLGPNCQELYNLPTEILKDSGPLECNDEDYNPIADINKDSLLTVADILIIANQVNNFFEQSEAWCQERLEDTTNPCIVSQPQEFSQDVIETPEVITPTKKNTEEFYYSGDFECIREGELIDITLNKNPNKKCCTGLTEINPCFQYISIENKCYTSSKLHAKCPTRGCIKCGDGICNPKEDVCNCPKDCIGEKKPNYETLKDFCIAMNYPSQNLCDAWDLCTLCNENNFCSQQGLKINNSYCSLNNTLEIQKEIDSECKKSYECKSDACFMNKCINKNLIQVVVTFFRELFN